MKKRIKGRNPHPARRAKARRQARCECCLSTITNVDDNTCQGCGAVVCVNCVSEYGHWLNDKHIIPRELTNLIRSLERRLSSSQEKETSAHKKKQK